MRQQFEKIKKEFEENLHSLKDFFVLEDIRTKFLGRKGELSNLMKQLKDVAEEERRELGKIANEIKETMEYAFLKKQQELEISLKQERLKNEWIDITAPGKFPLEGHLHPVTQAMNEITDIFSRIGFIRVQVPEIDWDYYTFEALNMPKDHPARDNWETFFVDLPTGEKGKIVAVPHISNMQVRIMEAWGAPLRALYIGRAYRRQNDPSHLPIHHQFEILMVDEGVTLANLKGVIEYFVHEYFGADRQIRYRPHHFRFTEPSFEIDISCDICKGTGRQGHTHCRLCKEGWLELAGAGMTHPNVLKAGGIDTKKYTALAFAFGIERTFMMRGGISVDDIRILYKNDLRFLKQF